MIQPPHIPKIQVVTLAIKEATKISQILSHIPEQKLLQFSGGRLR